MTTIAAAPAAMRRTLKLPQYLGYAAGDAACNLAFSMSSMFLLLYYTDVVGISAAAAGTLFLVVRAWDAFADVFAGRVVDKSSTRWGKFRPFFLFGGLPVLLLSVATFSVPGGLSDTSKLMYAYVTYALLGLAYSLVNIPYGSLAAGMTQLPQERAKLASFRVVGSNLTILLLAFVVAPQIRNSDSLQRSLTITTLAFVVLGYALFLVLFKTARENVERDVASVSLRQTLTTVRANKPLLLLCLSALLFLTGWFSVQTVGAYYARDVLGNANLFIVMTIVASIATFIIAPFIPAIIRVMGKKRAYITAGLIGMAGGVGLALSPTGNPALPIAFYGLLNLGLAAVNTLMWAIEADTVEYGEWKTGIRTEGATYAMFSFTRKLGQSIGGAAAAYTIGLGGYISGRPDAVQPESAVTAIKVAMGLVPSGFILLAVAVMLTYPLTEKVFQQIVAETAQRRAARIAAAA
jgi:glucuronide carrier protein